MEPQTETFKAWLAGFFDGEGHISLDSQGSELRTPKVCIAQKGQLELLNEIQRIYGGGVYAHTPNGVHRWYVSSYKDAKQFLNDVFPYLRVKKGRAHIALLICDAIDSQEKFHTNDREKILRLTLQEKFDELRERGIQ